MKRVFGFLLAFSWLGMTAGCGSDDSGGGGASCHDGCVATLAAKCADGPADQASCESDCNSLATGPCGAEFKAVQSCSAGKPVTCSADGSPQIMGCDTQQSAFVACLLK